MCLGLCGWECVIKHYMHSKLCIHLHLYFYGILALNPSIRQSDGHSFKVKVEHDDWKNKNQPASVNNQN